MSGYPGTGAAGRIRQRVGPTLRAMRVRQKLSLQEMADLAGVSSSHLSRIERRITVPSHEVVAKIASAVGSDLTTVRIQERSARETDQRLDAMLVLWGLSATAREELMGLSDETRTELAATLPNALDREAAS